MKNPNSIARDVVERNDDKDGAHYSIPINTTRAPQMSEEIEEPMPCVDCGGTLTEEDAISIALGEESVVYWHMEPSGCIASLGERLALATQRAEVAEAELAALRRAITAWARRL
jgi:hypothetical protein